MHTEGSSRPYSRSATYAVRAVVATAAVLALAACNVPGSADMGSYPASGCVRLRADDPQTRVGKALDAYNHDYQEAIGHSMDDDPTVGRKALEETRGQERRVRDELATILDHPACFNNPTLLMAQTALETVDGLSRMLGEDG